MKSLKYLQSKRLNLFAGDIHFSSQDFIDKDEEKPPSEKVADNTSNPTKNHEEM